MKKKLLSLFLTAVLVLSLCACSGTVGEIAGNVASAAMDELENQVKKVLEENKLEVVELKTAYGKLNDEGPEKQFFCAALVKANSEAVAKACADTLNKICTASGVLTQTGSTVESPYLVHKNITFQHSDFSDGTYYVVYLYQADLTIELPSVSK